MPRRLRVTPSVIGSGWVTSRMFSATPATASRLNVMRGFGQRPALITSARDLDSGPRRLDDRAVIGESRRPRPRSGDGLRDGGDRPQQDGRCHFHYNTRIEPLTSKMDWQDDGTARRIGTEEGGAREASDASQGGS
jgi:hypothetical protein